MIVKKLVLHNSKNASIFWKYIELQNSDGRRNISDEKDIT